MSDKKSLVISMDNNIAGSVLNEFAKQMHMAGNKTEIDELKKYQDLIECLGTCCTLLDDLDFEDACDKVTTILDSVKSSLEDKQKILEKEEKTAKEKEEKAKESKKEASIDPNLYWANEVKIARDKISKIIKK